jgi:hypothetical protein
MIAHYIVTKLIIYLSIDWIAWSAFSSNKINLHNVAFLSVPLLNFFISVKITQKPNFLMVFSDNVSTIL